MKRLFSYNVFMVRFCWFLVGITVLSFTVLSSSPASADASVSASASVTVGSACTLSAVENTAHIATIPAGTSRSEIGQTTFTMVCNDNGGYSIYAIGYGNNELGNTKLLANINGILAPSYDINTGTNASGTPSSWAMKLTPSTNLTASNIVNGYGSYSVVPTTYTKVATLVPATTVTNSSSLLATYRVNVAHTQPAGNYYGKVRFVMVNPAANVPNEPKTCAANKICYWPNGGDTTPAAQGGVGVPDTMGDQSITSSATSATLWASNFKRPGYGFAGWSDAYDYVVNVGSESNPNAHIYGPNEDITFTAGQYQGTSKGLSLYAVWVKSEGDLQSWNGCSALGSGKVTALTDQRDNDTYAVAKLADGNCWMIENLRLDYDADITTANTQSNNGAFGGVFAGLAQPETANFDDSTTANSLYKSDGSGDIKGVNGATLSDIGTTNYSGYRFPRYRNDNTNTNSTINPNTTVANMTGTGQNVYSYGNYYTWAAAMANTNYYSSPTATDANNKTSETANTSLCPTGWKLPRGGNKTRIEGGTSDLYTLGLAIVGTAPANYSSGTQPYWYDNSNTEGTDASKDMRAYPNNFLYSGRTFASSVDGRGSSGCYWSSTACYSEHSYYLNLLSSSVSPGTDIWYKRFGYSIRCLVGS